MSLVVSMRVPDGIVVAADSLSTSVSHLELVAQGIEFQCPKCKSKVGSNQVKFPPVPIPFSASSYTQKLFTLGKRCSLSSFGMGVINNRSIHYHINQMLKDSQIDDDLKGTKDYLIQYMERELKVQYPKYQEEAPEDWHPLGIHLNGFEEQNGKWEGVTYEIYIGRKNIERRHNVIGCTIGGDMRVVKKLWDIGKEAPGMQFKYQLFSLQDAIDLCTYFIDTTSTFQRFANEVPTVGGEIDIALITPFQGFQWIKRKKLMAILEECK